ncbi:MAG: hypothetical protein JXR36_01310 [Bacteroidales bacterium]|nr:hypothetical protein [Bacteroidales bacterium]
MAELENKVKLEGWSCKLTKDTKETLTELQNSGDFATVNQMMETLIERYYSPIKAQDQSEIVSKQEKEIESLKNQFHELQEKYNILREEKTNCSDDIGNLNSKIEELTSQLALVISERNQLEQDVINATVKGELPENGRIIVIDPLNWQILKFVAEREGKKRNQEWTPEDVINYFVHHRFEKGDVNGGFRSVPDSDIKKMKDELNAE